MTVFQFHPIGDLVEYKGKTLVVAKALTCSTPSYTCVLLKTPDCKDAHCQSAYRKDDANVIFLEQSDYLAARLAGEV